MNYYDFIIVGGGASGLLMAYRMVNDPFFDSKTILILDKEKKSKNDRTWCFWEEDTGFWDDILKTFWSAIIFKGNNFIKQESILPYSYKMVRSADFYQKIWQVLNKCETVTFIKTNVEKVVQEKNQAKVTTSEKEYSSKNVLNSILFSNEYKKQTKYPLLQQHFVGYFIRTNQDVFDDSCATFMDFDIDQRESTRFMYVLPYSKREALFEYTLFSSNLLPQEEYEEAIQDYLVDKGVVDYEIIEKEKGAIPMTCYPFWKSNSKNIIHIGTAGGWSKPSTGFTFKNIDRNTQKLINHLKENKSFTAFHKKTKFWIYDLLLLDILYKRNHLGAFIFGQMFKNNNSRNILKFLDEETTFLQDIRIQIKMPIFLFMRAIFNRIFKL